MLAKLHIKSFLDLLLLRSVRLDVDARIARPSLRLASFLSWTRCPSFKDNKRIIMRIALYSILGKKGRIL